MPIQSFGRSLGSSASEAHRKRRDGARKKVRGRSAKHHELGNVYLVDVERGGLKRNTSTAYRQALTNHLEPFFGAQNVNTITYQQCDDFVRKLEQAGLKLKSITRYGYRLSEGPTELTRGDLVFA